MESRRNNSKKREAILEVLRSSKEHPSAEMIHTALRERDSDIGIATVYRNLSILQEDGLIRSVGNVDGQERYDAELRPHGHFVCNRCGSVLDIELPENEAFSQMGGLVPEGCRVSSCEVKLSGLCGSCAAE